MADALPSIKSAAQAAWQNQTTVLLPEKHQGRNAVIAGHQETTREWWVTCRERVVAQFEFPLANG